MPNWRQVLCYIAIALIICGQSQERIEGRREVWIVEEKEEEKGGGGREKDGEGPREPVRRGTQEKETDEGEPMMIDSQSKRSPKTSLWHYARRTRRGEDEASWTQDSAPSDDQGTVLHGLEAPKTAIPEGGNLRLECNYEAGGNDVNSVRWWRGNKPFYSFVPKNAPHDKVDYGLRGVNVVVSQSDSRFVTLRDISMATSGEYRCEVMNEAPRFQSMNKMAYVKVVHAPEPPVLEGVQSSYRVESLLDVTCKMRRSIPAAKFVFVLNGQRIDPDSPRTQTYAPVTEHVESISHKNYYSSSSSNSFSPSSSSSSSSSSSLSSSSSFPSSSFPSSSFPSSSSFYQPPSNSSDTRPFMSRLHLRYLLPATFAPRLSIVCMAFVDTYIQNVSKDVEVNDPRPFSSLFLNNGKSTFSAGGDLLLVGIAVFLNLLLTCSAVSYSPSSYVSSSTSASTSANTRTATTESSPAEESLARNPSEASRVRKASAVSRRNQRPLGHVVSPEGDGVRPTRRNLISRGSSTFRDLMEATTVSTTA